MRNPGQEFGSESKLSWVVQREVIYDHNKSDSSNQARAGTRRETWVWWEIYDKTIMRMRLQWRNWTAKTGTRQGVTVGERQTLTKTGRSWWAAELKLAKTGQKSKHLPKGVPLQDADWNPGLWIPLFLWFLNTPITKKPVNSVDIKMMACGVSVFSLCFTKNLLSPIPVRWGLYPPVQETKPHATFSNMVPKLSNFRSSIFQLPFFNNSFLPSYQAIMRNNEAFQDCSCGCQKKPTLRTTTQHTEQDFISIH